MAILPSLLRPLLGLSDGLMVPDVVVALDPAPVPPVCCGLFCVDVMMVVTSVVPSPPVEGVTMDVVTMVVGGGADVVGGGGCDVVGGGGGGSVVVGGGGGCEVVGVGVGGGEVVGGGVAGGLLVLAGGLDVLLAGGDPDRSFPVLVVDIVKLLNFNPG